MVCRVDWNEMKEARSFSQWSFSDDGLDISRQNFREEEVGSIIFAVFKSTGLLTDWVYPKRGENLLWCLAWEIGKYRHKGRVDLMDKKMGSALDIH